MEVMAFVLAHRQRIPLRRDLLLVVTCDEESGSSHGAEYLTENHPRELEAAWGLNEGGAGWKLPDEEAILCGFGEKGPLWVRLRAEGRSGHGSTPHGENPCQHIVSALNALLERPRSLRVLPQMRGFLEGLGLWGLSSETLATRPELNLPNIRAMFHDTMSLTMLKAGSRPNVIPDRAEATIDMRILPDRTTREVFEEVKGAIPDGPVTVETIMALEASSSPLDTELYQCIERLSRRFFPTAKFLPAICPGFTDSRCFRSLGTACYGWIPAMIEAGDLTRMHGKDERIRIQDLVLGIRVILEMIEEVCS
jgi:acetylornithine deacetylase/succinyl-diaminopimelate desuccinylase-like protein